MDRCHPMRTSLTGVSPRSEKGGSYAKNRKDKACVPTNAGGLSGDEEDPIQIKNPPPTAEKRGGLPL